MELLKKYGGAILTGVAALVVVIALAWVFWLLMNLVNAGNGSLPLIAIGGVVVLIFMLTVVAMMFSIRRNSLRASDRLGVPLLVSTRHRRWVPRISKFGVLPARGGLSLRGTSIPP